MNLPEKKTVLIIEDDADIRESVHILLKGSGYTVLEAADGEEGLKLFSDQVSLIILDVMMPGLSGLQVCETIRERSVVPILFLTARTTDSDKLRGFHAGADDYIVKPFSYTELLARIEAVLRRQQIYDRNSSGANSDARHDKWLEAHDIRMNGEINRVYKAGAELDLTNIEYQILRMFMRHPNMIFSTQTIYESIWNEPYMSTSANTVMVHIRNLRNKIEENPQHSRIIVTVWGKGYRLG